MEELYDSLYGSNVTIISNDFLDKFLSDASPEKIKVFLFYFWKGIKEGYTISETSNEIDLPEEDIERSLKFWIKKKIFKKDCLVYDRTNDKPEKKYQNDKTDNLVDFQTKKNELINKNKKNYDEIESDLLFQAEKLLGQTMSERQQVLIAKCYNEYGFDEGLIQYLLEYCANNDKRNAKYMAAVAESWYEQKIKTAEDAKKYTEGFASSSRTKTKKKTNVIDRNEYNRMFMDSVLKSKIKP